ncbi:MAG: prepilin-type N-terminal cleavage/methylation domain-containing protein [Planctomycetota bacterium]
MIPNDAQSRRQTQRHRSAFTLVELLVVIGIIALLISILLPTLSRARASASSVACLSNLRQIGVATTFYTESNNGILPIGEIGYPDGDGDDWPILLNDALAFNGGGTGFAGGNQTTEIFLCPSADGTGKQNTRNHYSSHPALVPNMRFGTDPMKGFGSGNPQPYKIGPIKDSSNIATFWDSTQNLHPDAFPVQGNASFVSTNLRWERADTGTVGRYDEWSRSVNLGYWQRVSPETLDSVVEVAEGDVAVAGNTGVPFRMPRIRHGDNDRVNFVYLDGHAASLAAPEVKLRQFAVMPQ